MTPHAIVETARPALSAREHALRLVRETGITHKRIAEAIGYSRCAVTMWLAGTYAGRSRRIEAAYMDKFAERTCPHDGEVKLPVQCRRVALRPRPAGFPDAESAWLACQTCPHKPIQ